MNKKGFTLIELLAVLTILIIIFLLVFPSIKNIISSSEDTVNQTQINTILNASYDYSLENLNILPKDGNKVFITLGQLKNYGYISSDVRDSNTDEQFPDDYVISISNVGSNYKNEDTYAKKSGNYLYKVEVELMNSSNYESKKPEILLLDIEDADSKGNYFKTINQGDEYIPADYIAKSSNGNDITDNVVVNIMYNNNIVDDIDTSKIGIYYVNYTVIDAFGYANTIVRSITINDIEAPKIIFPENNTISVNLNSYDLMEGVSCTDNSNSCDIIIENAEDVKFGVVGKYIVKYIVRDLSGNTTISERIITIE